MSDNSPVENKQYCMPSMQKRNVDSMNKDMGYHNMADQANTPKAPTSMEGAKKNVQLAPQAANGNYDYNSKR